MPTSFCSLTNHALAVRTVSSGRQFSFDVSRGVVRIEINKYADDYHIGNDQDVVHCSILRWTRQLVHDGREGSSGTRPSKKFSYYLGLCAPVVLELRTVHTVFTLAQSITLDSR